MNKRKFIFVSIIYSVIFSIISNSYDFSWNSKEIFFPFLILFITSVLFAGVLFCASKCLRTKICFHGVVLLSSFVTSSLFSILYQSIFGIINGELKHFIFSSLFCIVCQGIVFWVGIICVYTASFQLGIKTRLLGIICGLIPILNLIMLRKIIKIVYKEVCFESEKEALNKSRKNEQVCKTKYPILLVHGIFFRDFKYFNYWGRIVNELEKNGAVLYYGNHQSASSVDESANELSKRIQDIITETGCEKVNIIAHSKGGLDCRKAIMNYDIAPYVASLTTINTPHKGCIFAEYLLNTISEELKNSIADKYNKTLKKLGDENPDFLSAVNDLTASCAFEDEKEKFKGIYCQSVGSLLKKAAGGKFPLNFSYHLVKRFDGANDGLVSEDSFPWGEKYTFLKPTGNEGISHGDMIDLHRINVEGFDVREFYVTLVNDLKNRGL